MATKRKRLSFYISFFLIICTLTKEGGGYSCPYGRHCGYDPAPPGRAPPCALPGLTFCVYPDPYPENVIRNLVEAGQYNINTLLSDETTDEFNQMKPDYGYGYGPNSLHNVDQISIVNDPVYNGFNRLPNHHDFFSQKTPLQPPSPLDPVPYNPNITKFNGFYATSPSWNPQNSFDLGFRKNSFRSSRPRNYGIYNQNFRGSDSNYESTDWFRQASSGVTNYNPADWWKFMSPSRSDVTVERSITFPTRSSTVRGNSTLARKRRNAELVKAARNRQLTGAEALQIALGFANAEVLESGPNPDRPRRQAAEVEPLCRVRTQFVTPRAALNNKGSWKYVVNMPENMTQLVKAEICISTECSGLCTVPLGYTTRCEQKYIQKRLVALESNGQSLYTDVFWIPSCCQCTIVAT